MTTPVITDLAELPSIHLPTCLAHILKQADRLINMALLELPSSEPSAPLAALLAAAIPLCQSIPYNTPFPTHKSTRQTC